MGENSAIAWTTHTFNPWTGCQKVSPACDHCYAESWAKRSGLVEWGPGKDRRRTSEANWRKPIKWNRETPDQGARQRVFCASLADVFDNAAPDEWRADLWSLIRETPNLDWLLLTKRPQNLAVMLPDDWGDGYVNVWLGTTVENQTEADRRVPLLLRAPAAVHFLSCEPLLGPLDLRSSGWLTQFLPRTADAALPSRVDWVIAGGESGPGYRAADPDWFRSLRDQCSATGARFLFKQWSGPSQKHIKAKGRELDGREWNEYPAPKLGVAA